jgi:hypothetical protein
MVALAPARPNVKSFSLVHPIVDATSAFEITAFAMLSLAALGIWLLLLPLEMLRLLGT